MFKPFPMVGKKLYSVPLIPVRGGVRLPVSERGESIFFFKHTAEMRGVAEAGEGDGAAKLVEWTGIAKEEIANSQL